MWRSSATRKAEYGHGVDSPSPENDKFGCFAGPGISLPKIEIKGDLSNDERKQSRGSEFCRNQYALPEIDFRGGDGDSHFATKLAR